MVRWVFKFPRKGDKIRWIKSAFSKENIVFCKNLHSILETKVFQKLKLSKNVKIFPEQKILSPKLIILNEKNTMQKDSDDS